jgi:predicted transcriptional regulator
VHRSLRELGRQAPVEEVLTPAVSLRQSVRQDYVVCLDCGYRGKTLRRHVSTRHGLSRVEYLQRWGLQNDHPLTAPAYSEHRSTLAKQLGLGRKPKAEEASEPATGEFGAATPKGEGEAGSKARRTSRSRSRQGRARSPVAQAQSEPTATPNTAVNRVPDGCTLGKSRPRPRVQTSPR